MDYRVQFESIAWTSPMAGVREKRYQVDARVLRLVEYSVDMVPHWCTKGHIGHIVEGTIDIEFPTTTLSFSAGDTAFIPPGTEHAHRAVPKTPLVTALFVEDV